jgi:branched-chain amino acid transport system permease protein
MTTLVLTPPRDANAQARPRRLAFVLLAVLLAVAPLVVYPVYLMKIMCFALFASAFNLLIGYVGLLSFGHAMFFGVAAYTAGHAAKVWGFTPELAVLAGTLCAAVLGLASGLLAIRRQGIYFAMITLAIAQMVYFLLLQAPFTGGENGLQAVPRGAAFGLVSLENTAALYVFVLAVFLGGTFILWRAVHSPFGQVLRMIRENEPRAISLGYEVDRYKLLAFVLSAALAGAAGATKALVFQLAALPDAHWSTSGEVVLMTLLGGLGTLLGPIVGAALLVAMHNALAQLDTWVMVVQGLVFMVCVLAFRRGVVGELAHRLRVSL